MQSFLLLFEAMGNSYETCFHPVLLKMIFFSRMLFGHVLDSLRGISAIFYILKYVSMFLIFKFICFLFFSLQMDLYFIVQAQLWQTRRLLMLDVVNNSSFKNISIKYKRINSRDGYAR